MAVSRRKGKEGNYKTILKKASKDMSTRLDKAYQAYCYEAIALLTYRTPVDTGAARFHWFARLLPSEQFDKERVDPEGQLAPRRAKRDLKLFRVTQVVYLVNSAPYFKYLEDGSSTQAPNGVVGITRATLSASGRWPKLVEAAFSIDPRGDPSGSSYAQGGK